MSTTLPPSLFLGVDGEWKIEDGRRNDANEHEFNP
jgi:hypothetical protein